jgi:hypothetical protein
MADNPKAGDETLLVRFHLSPLRNDVESKKAGREVWEDKEFITIRAPGAKDFVERVATTHDKQRFARHYQAFKANMAEPEIGTPLKEWAAVGRADVEMLNYHGVKTVEQLAGMSDSNLQNLGPGKIRLRQQAKDFLEQAKGNAPAAALRAELEKRDGQIAVLMQAVQKLQQEKGVEVGPVIEFDAPPKRRGRPPKAKEAV